VRTYVFAFRDDVAASLDPSTLRKRTAESIIGGESMIESKNFEDHEKKDTGILKSISDDEKADKGSPERGKTAPGHYKHSHREDASPMRNSRSYKSRKGNSLSDPIELNAKMIQEQLSDSWKENDIPQQHK
jgi:hypothetical protein